VDDRDAFCTKRANDQRGGKAATFKQLRAELAMHALLSLNTSLGSVHLGTESGRGGW
jgi:hypothetical protein